MSQEIVTINPSTEEVISKYSIVTTQELDSKIKKAHKAFGEWKKNINNRSDHFHNFAQQLRKDKEILAMTATKEMGKIIKEARSEVEKCAWAIEYFADNGESFVEDEITNTNARKTYIKFSPLGVIASIMPWNFPYWQAIRFAAPSLMTGNTTILKPASATIQCGIEIENTANKAGMSEGVFQSVIGNSNIVKDVIDSEYINAVTFTGSVKVGSLIASQATSKLKKCVLELGGSDPFIICKDADIEKAAEGAVKGRFINCGQSCIASKRFILVEDVKDEFLEKFVSKTEKLKIGNPESEDSDIGPLVNFKALEKIDSQVKGTIKEGAEVILGSQRIDKSVGYFYEPTIIKNVTPKMSIAQEEVFGPVAPIIIAKDEKEAVDIANDSEYGLGASIWTENLDRAEKLAENIDTGIVSVNNVVASDPRVPFGGIKKSGFGRELSRYGMLEFVNIKSIRLYDQLFSQHHVE
ncbi:MAG: NAD-dependent succinate-semialdehyde dehydrogenase [Candidatus Nitrosocosmicus sp.]|nr:NAD-dependent succinate-semialdehyde dehydrogenase [Candidatus Nitrosocosmicus sp.]MDN5866570.1 NAD-dependent succinate-semialdehyde dehydrogenase [Candidatus Nitrosocosmicus sp.]